MTRPLGSVQRGVLGSLADQGPYPGGWYWNNHSTTVHVLESLVERGLVTRSSSQDPQTGLRRTSYTINSAGREAIR